MYKKNPKKHPRDRRIRFKKTFASTKAVAYAEVKLKSQSGVEYTHYMPVVINI